MEKVKKQRKPKTKQRLDHDDFMAKFMTGFDFGGVITMNKMTFDSIKHLKGQTYIGENEEIKTIVFGNITVKKRLKYIYLVKKLPEDDAIDLPDIEEPKPVPVVPVRVTPPVEHIFSI